MRRISETRRFTSGEKLISMLGLNKFYTAYTRIFRLPYNVIIVYYDTRRPQSPITEVSVMNSKIPVNLFRLSYGPSATSHLMVSPLKNYDENIDNLLIFTVDLSGIFGIRNDQVTEIKKWKEGFIIEDGGLRRLDENVSAKDFVGTGAMSDFTKNFYDQRKSLVGGANRNTRLINSVYDRDKDWVTFVFKTIATPNTPEKSTTGGSSGRQPSSILSPNPDKTYFQMIRILDFVALLKDTRPDAIKNKKIVWADVREVVDVADVQMWCGCPSFWFQGIDYWLTQLDGSIYPCDIKPEHWNAPNLHGEGNAFICKHLGSLWNSIGFFGTQMASSVQKILRMEKII